MLAAALAIQAWVPGILREPSAGQHNDDKSHANNNGSGGDGGRLGGGSGSGGSTSRRNSYSNGNKTATVTAVTAGALVPQICTSIGVPTTAAKGPQNSKQSRLKDLQALIQAPKSLLTSYACLRPRKDHKIILLTPQLKTRSESKCPILLSALQPPSIRF